jgi:rRNA biogenesis protein RRP5
MAQKRALEDFTTATTRKFKKSRITNQGTSKKEGSSPSASKLVSQEVDFPRGGGTTFTPLEVKAIRAEAVKEANNELFEVKNLTYSWWFVLILARRTLRLTPKKLKSANGSLS